MLIPDNKGVISIKETTRGILTSDVDYHRGCLHLRDGGMNLGEGGHVGVAGESAAQEVSVTDNSHPRLHPKLFCGKRENKILTMGNLNSFGYQQTL